MVSGNTDPKTARALELAARYPAAREALRFYAAIAEFQGDWAELRSIVRKQGPALLREAIGRMSEVDVKAAVDRYLRGQDRRSPESFFGRVMLRHDPPTAPDARHMNQCPRCGEPPGCGCTRPEADGSAFSLVCSLCATEWKFPRGQCPVCGEAVESYMAQDMEHVNMQVCVSCGRYLHVVRIDKDPQAIPEVDEVAALPMDIWALEQGWEKVHPNLVGI